MPEREPDIGPWNEWGRAVLGDIRRVGDDVRHVDREVRGLSIKVELLTASAAAVGELEARVGVLEARGEVAVQRTDDRRWLIGLAVLVVASIIFPSLRVLLFGGSGG